MPLIAHRNSKPKITISAEIVEDVDELIQDYCHWAGITDLGFFIEEAVKNLIHLDAAWVKHLEEVQQNNSA